MEYICDSPDGKTWFRIQTEAEAAQESAIMRHAVEKHFRREWEKAVESYQPATAKFIERDIGLKAHVERVMPLFLTLRDGDGNGLATAMLPPGGQDSGGGSIIIVGPQNSDPFPQHGQAIAALAQHFGLTLDRDRCVPPYAR
jgi:hypothetical protein